MQMKNNFEPIFTPRLVLRLMTEEFLEASLDEDVEKAERLIGLKISPDWFDEKDLINFRLDGYRSDPAYIPWGMRALGRRDTAEMIGYINFHTRPNPEYLRPLAPKAIELGYTIFFNHRRRGFAVEAVKGLMNWAVMQYPLENFIASVSPTNIASTEMIKKLRFEKIGEHIDEFDGLEFIYALPAEKIRALSALE